MSAAQDSHHGTGAVTGLSNHLFKLRRLIDYVSSHELVTCAWRSLYIPGQLIESSGLILAQLIRRQYSRKKVLSFLGTLLG